MMLPWLVTDKWLSVSMQRRKLNTAMRVDEAPRMKNISCKNKEE